MVKTAVYEFLIFFYLWCFNATFCLWNESFI